MSLLNFMYFISLNGYGIFQKHTQNSLKLCQLRNTYMKTTFLDVWNLLEKSTQSFDRLSGYEFLQKHNKTACPYQVL